MRARTVKFILKALFNFVWIALIVVTCAIVIWRIFMLNTPKEMKGIDINETIAKAYFENGESLTIFNQEQSSVTRSEKNYGYFGAIEVAFIKEADEVQLVFRYNNSTLTHLKEDYNLAETPAKDGEYFDLSIYIVREVENENGETIQTSERIKPSSIRSMRNSLYNYRKAVFDNVVVDEAISGVFLDVYYVNDINYEEEAYGTLCLYDRDMENESINLSKAEIKELNNRK